MKEENKKETRNKQIKKARRNKKERKEENMSGFYFSARMHKSTAPGRSADYVLYGGAKYLWVLSVELASCHPSGA